MKTNANAQYVRNLYLRYQDDILNYGKKDELTETINYLRKKNARIEHVKNSKVFKKDFANTVSSIQKNSKKNYMAQFMSQEVLNKLNQL